MTDKVQKIREGVEKRYEYWKEKEFTSHSIESEIRMSECQHLLLMINSLQEEPVSEELEEAALLHLSKNYDTNVIWDEDEKCVVRDFKAGAKWQKAKDESTTEDLGDYINELSKQFPEVSFAKLSRIAVRMTKWQKEHLWKPADGDDLPEYEREVVVFTQNFPNDAGMMSVAIGHRPNPDGLDGKSLSTGKAEHYTPKTYDKGGWNVPDVVLWLDFDIPKIEED